MYQVIEYQDYRKENYILVHGVTSDLEKAKGRVGEILKKITGSHDEKDSFYQIYQLPGDHRNDYVYLSDRKNVVGQYTYRFIHFEKLLGKTVKELYDEILEEKIPKRVSGDTVITRDVFYNLVENELSSSLDFLQDTGDIYIDTFSTIVAVVKCEEF